MPLFDVFCIIFIVACSHCVYATTAFLSAGINSPCSTQDVKKCRSRSPEVSFIIPKLEDCVLPRRNSHNNNMTNMEVSNNGIRNQNLSISLPALSLSAFREEVKSDAPEDFIFERGAHQSASLEDVCLAEENRRLKKIEKEKIAQLEWLTLMQKTPEVKSNAPEDFIFERGAHQGPTFAE